MRLVLGSRVLLAVGLALAGAALAIDLADWRYVRIDLTHTRRNSLDDSVRDILERLPGPVTIDVFFRRLEAPYDRVSAEAQGRMLEVLSVAHNARRGQIDLRTHDLARLEETQARQTELSVEGVNLVVYGSGGRKAVQKLFGEIAVVDWGSPTQAEARYLNELGLLGEIDRRFWNPLRPRPAVLTSFQGEEALAEGLLKVSSGASPHAYFTVGSGEPGIGGGESGALTALAATLEGDGFVVGTWNPLESPDPPADAALLAAIGARQPLPQGTLERLGKWVKDGGALLAAPAFDEVERGLRGGIVDLLAGYGMVLLRGIQCEPLVGPSGERIEGEGRCAFLQIDERGLSASNAITIVLRDRGRRVQFLQTPSFRRAAVEGMFLTDLVTTSNDSWRDLPLADGSYDFRLDARGEERGRAPLAMLAEAVVGRTLPDGSVEKGRVLGVASAGFFSNDAMGVNRDFALNAFNALVEREYRVRVSALEHPESRLDLARSSALPILTYTLYLGLPGLCLAIALLVAWARRQPR
jgi:hypothetical protein